MTASEDIERRHRAWLALTEYARMMATRDALVREARAAGVRATDVAEIMRLSPRQVRRITAGQR